MEEEWGSDEEDALSPRLQRARHSLPDMILPIRRSPSPRKPGPSRSENEQLSFPDEWFPWHSHLSLPIDGRIYVLFHPVASLEVPELLPKQTVNLAFKIPRTDCGIVRAVLAFNGFAEVHPHSPHFNVQWTGCGLRPDSFLQLAEYQKVNHFPRSSEITRKDRLYVNVERMQQLHGRAPFNFVPKTYILPKESSLFSAEWAKDKSAAWIVKPASLSRGRGIRLVTHPDQIASSGPMVVCRYLTRPLLVDGFKFDLRLYVLVTSFQPLRVYLYEEGLARFATAKFDMSKGSLDNLFVHLTNYSVNKKSANYVSCPDASVEDYGNKWSLSALLQHLHSTGVDVSTLMRRVEDVVIKTILSGRSPVVASSRTSVRHSSVCMELFGFDVLIDTDLKPWLLEVVCCVLLPSVCS